MGTVLELAGTACWLVAHDAGDSDCCAKSEGSAGERSAFGRAELESLVG